MRPASRSKRAGEAEPGLATVAAELIEVRGWYCDPRWVSDHVYEQILGFMQEIGWNYAEDRGGDRAENGYIPPEAMNQPYECVSFGIDGGVLLIRRARA